ncbi:NADH pyrophosphatase [termite gut metagenome]|uniref:NAD(+) diphosphatase n=1 Tax=termite gut metagenome TaxID=433724 RepID=A0A5J4SDF0_9ZZZZ
MDTTQLSWWFVFYKDQLLLERISENLVVPCETNTPLSLGKTATIHDITTLDGCPCRAFSIPNPPENNERYVMTGLRESYNYISRELFTVAGKAREILHWDVHSRFCPVCGTPTKQITSIFKQCPTCGEELYPPIAIAILALVRKGDSVLLVRAHNFGGNFHSLVAGFLETGETLDECVQREVLEETGLRVKNITYFGNQPWPFPSGLMVGFVAEYDGGEIQLQSEELSFGAFYTKDKLPELPGKLSLARKMIDWWIETTP